jgi:hypothetical protein
MHVHANQINPNTQLDALNAAEKAAGKRAAESTRRKLLEFASELAGEADSEEDCVVKLGAREESEEHAAEQNQQGGARKPKTDAEDEEEDRSISDWA